MTYNECKGGEAMNFCEFGATLQSLRKSRSLTQKELGTKLGLSKAVVSKYENGLSYPSYDLLLQIGQFFDVTTDYLLGASQGRTIDVSGLSESQIDIVHKLIAEFKKEK